jgi:hypothetical protein
MLHHLLHPVRVFWNERIILFWPIWMAITAISVMLVMWVVPEHTSIPLERIESRRQDWSRSAVISMAFLILFLGCYIAASLMWEDFTYYDNSYFTNDTLEGHNIPISISPESGRFLPLALQEFNLVRHVTSSVTGYHALPIVQLLLLAWILLVFDEELSIKARVALIILVLITPSILISFSGLIYLEWNLTFCLVCLAWSVKCFEQTRSTAWAVAALVSSQFMLYFKETAFLLLLGFAVARLLLRCWNMKHAGWDLKRLRDPESRLDICLALLVVPFLLYYLAAMYPNYRTSYADESRLPLRQVLASYVKLDLLVWALVAVMLARIFLILRRKVAPSPLWDGLALAGIAYFAGYLTLRMYSAYYLAPVDLIAALYLGRLAILSVENIGPRERLWVLALLSLVLLQDLSLAAFRMYERKNVIHAKAEMGRMIEARYESDPQSVERLFFPFADPFPILEFASYLNYLGVPVEQVPAGSVATGSVVLVGKAIEKDGPCGYRTFVCHPGSRPNPGDLVVVLPDTLTYELNSYRQQGTGPLFSYRPRPAIPQWLYPYVKRLHVVSPIFTYNELPDLWLNASVNVWK